MAKDWMIAAEPSKKFKKSLRATGLRKALQGPPAGCPGASLSITYGHGPPPVTGKVFRREAPYLSHIPAAFW